MISSYNKPKKRGLKKETLKRANYGNMRVGNGMDRYPIGSGYVIIPSDVNREDYIKFAYQTGRVIIVEDFGNIIKDVLVPIHIIRDIVFPTSPNQRGSLVSWHNIPVTNQVIVTGVLLKPGEMYPYTETEKVENIGDPITISSNTSNPSHVISVVNPNGNIVDDSSRVKLSVTSEEGNAYVQSDSRAISKVYGEKMAEIDSEDALRLNVGSQEGEVSRLEINKDGSFNYTDRNGNFIRISTEGEMTIRGSSINIGSGAEQSAVLGDNLVTLLNTLIRGVLLINPSTAAANIPDITQAQTLVNNITSNLVKVE